MIGVEFVRDRATAGGFDLPDRLMAACADAACSS
jgi:hypothetical protein